MVRLLAAAAGETPQMLMRNVSKAVAGVAFVAGLDCVASTKLGLKVSPRA